MITVCDVIFVCNTWNCSKTAFKTFCKFVICTFKRSSIQFELKESGVTTIEEANAFLEKYIEKFNAQFAICEGIKSVWVEVTQEQIDYALVTIAKRTVDSDNEIRLNNNYYGTFDSYGNQIFIKPKTKVSVITMMDGSVYAMHDDKLLAMDIIPERQKFLNLWILTWTSLSYEKNTFLRTTAFGVLQMQIYSEKNLNFLRSIMDKIAYE